jgi:hypothetical protein
MSETELLPCKCGNGFIGIWKTPSKWFVAKCFRCGNSGPVRKEQEDAESAWNNQEEIKEMNNA